MFKKPKEIANAETTAYTHRRGYYFSVFITELEIAPVESVLPMSCER